MPDSEVHILLAAIDQAFDRPSWHGPNLTGSLRAVDHRAALWRPGPGRHNIWEYVLHAAYWKYVVRRRLRGEKRGSFPRKGTNWFVVNGGNPAAWREDRDLLRETHESMRSAVAQLKGSDLSKPLSKRGTTRLGLISGIAAHDVYHAGQIQLVKALHKFKT